MLFHAPDEGQVGASGGLDSVRGMGFDLREGGGNVGAGGCVLLGQVGGYMEGSYDVLALRN